MKPKPLKDSVWADSKFWAEQRAKYEASMRALSEQHMEWFSNQLAKQKQRDAKPCTGPHAAPSPPWPNTATNSSTPS